MKQDIGYLQFIKHEYHKVNNSVAVVTGLNSEPPN